MAPPTAGANTVFGLTADEFQELLTQTIQIKASAMETTPLASRLITSSGSVIPADTANKNFVTNIPYNVKVAPGFHQFDYDSTLLFGTPGSASGVHTRFRDAQGLFNDPREGARSIPFKLGIPISSRYGTLEDYYFDRIADENPSYVGDMAADQANEFGYSFWKEFANAVLANPDDNQSIAKLATADFSTSYDPGDGGGNRGRFVFTLDEGSVNRFHIGMRFNVVSTSDANDTDDTIVNRVIQDPGADDIYIGIVDDINYMSGEVVGYFSYLNPTTGARSYAAAATGTFAAAPIAGDYIVQVGTEKAGDLATGDSYLFRNTAGLRDYVKSSGTLLGDNAVTGSTVSIDDHRFMSSFLQNNVGTLTYQKLNLYVDRVNTALEQIRCGGQPHNLDFFVTTPQVINAMYAETDDQIVMSNGGPRGVTGGFDGVARPTAQGQTLELTPDRTVNPGTLWGLKGDGWSIHVPPHMGSIEGGEIPGPRIPVKLAGQEMAGMAEIPFFDTSAGWNNVTGMKYVPVIQQYQFAPARNCLPIGMLLTGLTEETAFTD